MTTSLLRSVMASPVSPTVVRRLWRAVAACLAFGSFLLIRACGYEIAAVGNYAGYFALYVGLPGVVVTYLVNQGPLSLTKAIALGIPTGFAIEILGFLMFSAGGARDYYPATPAGWAALLFALRARRGEWPLRVRLCAHHAGMAFALAGVFLATALMAASQMFAESPLAAGLPARAIFHDWVYLVSRAAVIKNNWPLDDPSLANTPLQYHYFMMVHAAAASWTTGVELTMVMLRLIMFPLGAVFVVQAYALGRRVSGCAWGGVLSAGLGVMASELSFSPHYAHPMFLGVFVRWLFVSPTFFFGLIFCGALLLAVIRCARLQRCSARHYLWLALLGAAGTGAKGTVLPVLICAMGWWILWRWLHEKRLPLRLVGFAAVLVGAFVAVYFPTMSAWSTGDAAFNPFHVFELTEFWQRHREVWAAGLARWIPSEVAAPVATLACAAVIFAGTCGVRLLAIPFLFSRDAKRRGEWVAWPAAVFFASAGMGLLMEMNSYGELYVILMMRLPMAALTAGFLVLSARRLRPWWRDAVGGRRGAGALMATLCRRGALVGGLAVLLAALAIQQTLWWTRNGPGFGQWWLGPATHRADAHMGHLHEALLWVRDNTERDAVLVPNAYTWENMKNDHWGALDRTLMGVHFYYSALSERRLWFEGPNYILDSSRARLRSRLASEFFYRGRPLAASLVAQESACYALVDRSLADGATVAFPGYRKIFANERIEIYRIPSFAHATVANK